MGISTHILDTSVGRPAAGVRITLARIDDAGVSHLVNDAATDADGRVKHLFPADGTLVAGRYCATFDVGGYYARTHQPTFYPRVQIEFVVVNAVEHFHVPLLLSPFGFQTYRGS
jgi:5-hydroxyisourate hydrolase